MGGVFIGRNVFFLIVFCWVGRFITDSLTPSPPLGNFSLARMHRSDGARSG